MREPRAEDIDAGILPRNVLYYGREEPLPARHELGAGALSAAFEEGQLLDIRWRGREVVRRIYVAVRDPDWGTVLPVFSDVRLSSNGDGFQVMFSARHHQDAIDFAWQGRIEAVATGQLTFTMEGVADSTFSRSRIGFCMLHATKACTGRPFRVGRPDGTEVEGSFPHAISLDPVIAGTEAMRWLRYEFVPGAAVRIQFEGDVFQMEDQRAWTDATFKSFCTPLQLPSPALVQRGDRVEQTIRLQVDEAGELPVEIITPELSSVSVGTDSPLGLPAIGLGCASSEPPLSDVETERLRSLHLSHLRVDLRLWEPEWRLALRRASLDAVKLHCALEVAISLADLPEVQLLQLLQALRAERPRISRYLVFRRAEASVSGDCVLLARSILAEYDSAPRFCSGTDANYYELTAFRPPQHGLDCVCFSMHPQTHAFDNDSLVETLEMQGEVVRNARRRYGDLPVCVTPVTLKPRFDLQPGIEPPACELARQVDTRQMSLFGACWTLGSLKHLCEAGAASLTYFETTGWRGVMERHRSARLPSELGSLPTAVFPTYHVLADVGEFGGGEIVPSASSDPLKVECLVLRKPGRERVLLGNMTGKTANAVVRGVQGIWTAMKRLDEWTVHNAMVCPGAFRSEVGERQRITDGSLQVTLPPHSIARLDSQE